MGAAVRSPGGHAVSRNLIVVGAIVAIAGTAAADQLLLHSQDSLTIDGTRYTCDDSSRKGVQLGPGDRVTAGRYQLKCVHDSDSGHDSSTRDISVQSRVEPTCISTLNTVIVGYPSASEVLRWADACRPFEVGSACNVTTSKPDDDCYSALNGAIKGTFSETDAPRAQRVCQRVEASCPAFATKVASKVELTCIEKLYNTTSGKPNGHTMVGWIESCRDHAIGACVVVGGSFDRDCVTKSFGMITGAFSAAEAASAARACRALELRCQ